MNLRVALMPGPVAPSRLAELVRLAHAIEEGRDAEADVALDRFNALTGATLERYDFYGLEGSMSVEEFVLVQCQRPRRVADITDVEYLEVIRRICEAEGREHEVDFWLQLLELNLGAPGISDLFYWPEQYLKDQPVPDPMTPEDILRLARDRTVGPQVIVL